MKKLLLLLLLFTSFFSNGQLKTDTLAKYSPSELLAKASKATHFGEIRKTETYYAALFRRNMTDSLQLETYYTIAYDYYSFTDYGVDYSIEAMKRAQFFAKQTGDLYSQVLCLDGLSLFYGIKGNNDLVLVYLKEMKLLFEDKSFNPLDKLKLEAIPYRIYSMIGDFKRANAGYLAVNKKIESYLAENPNLSQEDKKGLNYDMKGNYSRLISNYNLEKKLDSSAYYLKKAKDLEKLGYDEFIPLWYQETMYLILTQQYDMAIKKVLRQNNDYLMNSKNERQKVLYCLALCYEAKRDFKKSLQLCEQAFELDVHNFTFQNLDIELLKIASNSAKKIGRQDKALAYSEEYTIALQDFNYQEKARFITSLYDQDLISPLDHQLKEERNFSGYFLIASIALFAIASYLLWRSIKSRQDKKQFLTIIRNFEEQQKTSVDERKIEELEQEETRKEEFREEVSENDAVLENANLKNQNNSININEDTEKKIVKLLARFEKREQFLSQNITAGSLASDFNTNAVYLSTLLKKHKQNNFNGYINQLRINYIIEKLQNNPEYSTYKIAYLAEESGFSSHTSFIRIFTQINGIPPSKFINLLNKFK